MSPVLAPLIGAGILAGIGIAIGFVLLIVPGLFLLTIWAVLVPVIVLERTGVFPSFGRSRQLVRGHGWQVFGVLVVLFLLFLVIRILVAAIISGIADTFAGFALADLIVNLLTVPISGLAASVIYFELKRLHGEPIRARPREARSQRRRREWRRNPPRARPCLRPLRPARDRRPRPSPVRRPRLRHRPAVHRRPALTPGRRRADRRRRRTPDAYQSFAAARNRPANSRPRSFWAAMRASLSALSCSGS